MRKWLNGTDKHVPQHYSGTRPTAGRVLSRTRSLTAAAIAVAMMATVAVISLLPTYNAKAEEPVDGKTCTPASVGLGDDMSVTGTDTGVATYVGGDMYVGGKPSDANALNSGTGPIGTYAVEAEGLTVVNGSLAMNPQKEAWKLWNTGNAGGKSYVSRGFRWGVVGFGSQFRPADGKTVLAVGGNTSTSVMGSKKVGAWTAPGWLGKTSSTDTTAHGYTASLAGEKTQVWGKEGVDSVRGLSGSDTTTSQPPVLGIDSSLVTWNQGGLSNVNGTDYSGYKGKISKLSTDLSNVTKLPATGNVTTSTAPSASSYTIYKYDYKKNGNKGNSFTFYGGLDKEKLITFTSTDISKSMQVFNLPASELNLSGTDYTGIDFKFVNVPDNASVVVNVTGANGQTIDFHNGWRFWWNNDNIANDFVTAASAADTEQTTKNTNYAKHAQQIMWNFADASNVVIRGGQATGWIQVTDHNTNTNTNHGAWGSAHDMRATDDPSAAWMGSILVPNGSLQSHVSTNGRVWVGGDFEMLNNETVKRVEGQSSDHAVGSEFINESGEKTTSILDMDQERHNLPWNGSYSTTCAAIAWDKVDDTAGHNALGGTSWTVYGKKEDAVRGTNALATIADGGWNDDADAEGSFQLGNLAPNGTYFLKESGTAEGYAQNTNIYQINTGNSTTDAATNISSVFDSAGRVISTDADKLLTTDGKIINKKTGSAIEWQKVDGTDNSTLLAGSTWTLSKMNGNTAEQSWNIIDDQSGTEVKSVKIFDANNNEVASASFTNSTAQQFRAVAYDQNGTPIDNAKLTWSSADSAVAAVSENGLVTPTGNGNTTITVKSADGNVTASFTVEVSGVTVETSVSISGYTNGQEISLEKGKTRNLIASVDPEGNTVTWSTSNADNVSLSAFTGTDVTLTANSVTSSPVIITATETRTNKTFTLKVNVTAKQYLTLYFQAQNNWPANNVKVHYQTTNDTVWADINMTQMDGSCNGYAYANIPLTGSNAIDSTSQFGFQHINGSGWYGPGSASVPKANDQNFKFTNDNTLPEVVVISAGPSYSTTAPSGCAVTSTAAYSSRRVAARSGEHRAVASVLRTQSNVVNVLENSTVSSKQDEDTAAGKFKVSDLVDGTYHLQEETAPNGYEKSGTVYTITITDGNASWSSDITSDITDSKIANTRKTGAVTWTKVSSDPNNANPLPGSQWTLKQTKTFSWENDVAKYTDADATLGTVTDCVSGKNNVTDCSAQTGTYVDLDGDEGEFKISGLGWGEYELIESTAPDGYNLDSTPHTFRIGPAEGSDVTGDWYTSSDFNPTATAAYDANDAFTVDGGSITNTPGVVLPSTGGEGLNKMYTAGFLAVAIAVAGLALSLRRRQS